MNIDEITAYIVAIMPSVVAVISVMTMIFNCIKQTKSIKEDIEKMTELEELKNQVTIVIQENYKLKKNIDEMVEVVTKIKK